MARYVADERVACIIEAGGNRYVQFLVTEDQHVVIECVSNRFLEGEDLLTLDDELTLLSAGFAPPEPDHEPHPNWWWHADNQAGIMEACVLAALVLRDVFKLSGASRVDLIERPLGSRR